MLSKARQFAPIDKLISIYFAIFSSHMTYGCQIWGVNKSSLHFKKIERLQKKAVRIMSFSRHDAPSEPIFRKFNILKLKDQITLFNFCSFMTKLTISYHLTLMTSSCLVQIYMILIQEEEQVVFLHLNIHQTLTVVNQLKCQPS